MLRASALSSKHVAILSVLVAGNVALEFTLGTFLHAVNFPLTGSVMVGINLLVYALAYTRVPRFGAITLMGLVTALLNFVFTGGFKLGAISSIVIEAAFIDVLLSCLGIGRRALLFTGGVAGLLSACCALLNAFVVYGTEGVVGSVEKLTRLSLGLDYSFFDALVIVAIIRIVVGVLFAVVAIKALEVIMPAVQLTAEQERA